MLVSEEFIRGFNCAVERLGNEGDERGVDWSAAYSYLRESSKTLETRLPQDVLGLKIVVSETVASDVIEFHHRDGRVDRLKLK